MNKNRENIINELLEKTEYKKEECEQIVQILNNHPIIGRKNKEKIMTDFINTLNISKLEADALYNICMECVLKSKF